MRSHARELAKNGRRLALSRGPGTSDYIETHRGFRGKEGILMSAYETLSITMMVLSIVVMLLIAYINSTKK